MTTDEARKTGGGSEAGMCLFDRSPEALRDIELLMSRNTK